MIQIIEKQNIFNSKCEVITNTVNCVGVSGAGLAKQFKDKFPDYEKEYIKRCNTKEITIGVPSLIKRPNYPYILAFPTKNHWKNPSRMSYITDGLIYVKNNYKNWGINSLALPALGCGLGGLKVDDVFDEIYSILNEEELAIEFYKG